jgi:hypothetical protein
LVAPSVSAARRVLTRTAAWSAKAVGLGERPGALDQRQPFAGAVVVELGDVERALVEQVATRRCGSIGGGADIFVDVFEARIVTRVADDGLALDGRGEDDALMGEAAQRGALDRRALGIERVDLDHPAEGVGLVAVVARRIVRLGRGIEAGEVVGAAGREFPAVARGPAGHAVTGMLARQVRLLVLLVGIAEVAGPILLGRHIGVPGRDAVRAVVQRAAGRLAGRAVLGLDEIRAADRARDLHRRQAVDAAVVRILDHTPATVGALGDADDADPVGGDFLQDLVGVAAAVLVRRHITGIERLAGRCLVHEARLDIFVVEDEQAVLRAAVDREEVHAVMVRADLHGLLLARVVERVGGHGAGDGCAPGDQRLRHTNPTNF